MKKILITVCLLSVIAFFILIFSANTKVAALSTAVYTVQQDDTLWDISVKFAPDDIDIRRYKNEIKKINDLEDTIIYPGQKLIVLVSE